MGVPTAIVPFSGAIGLPKQANRLTVYVAKANGEFYFIWRLTHLEAEMFSRTTFRRLRPFSAPLRARETG